ncbi:2-oxo acid dehydrogenase subunit E2 [Flavobacteriaceae bacterium F08102]|nr:2-oxo acid dehydrogenase subunit E2 [Flavobacteriaceae bacterium F08102]
MAKFELKLPKMGESVAEATITSWLKEVGDTIELDEAIVEIATDKVDSEVPSEVEGVLIERLFEVDDVVKVGETLAIIEVEGGDSESKSTSSSKSEPTVSQPKPSVLQEVEKPLAAVTAASPVEIKSTNTRFYSPLVKTIAKKEQISEAELAQIPGTGKDGRVTKDDMLNYLKHRGTGQQNNTNQGVLPSAGLKETAQKPVSAPVSVSGGDEIVEMTRMGKLIAHHMIDSVQTSAHVQSFIEVDVTNIVHWRNRIKNKFFEREGEKITFTPIFMEAVAKAIKEFPMINISVDGDKIIKKKNINLGMAAALPDGNLIVPVIKNADQLNLVGMTRVVNDLATRARSNNLKPDDVQGGTYTVTNVGSFGSVMGTPIINQPQVAILALGAIRKVPAVIETKEGDFIGIRHKMFLSHSYDHRVVNGALGGTFIKRVAELLEGFDVNREF